MQRQHNSVWADDSHANIICEKDKSIVGLNEKINGLKNTIVDGVTYEFSGVSNQDLEEGRPTEIFWRWS